MQRTRKARWGISAHKSPQLLASVIMMADTGGDQSSVHLWSVVVEG